MSHIFSGESEDSGSELESLKYPCRRGECQVRPVGLPNAASPDSCPHVVDSLWDDTVGINQPGGLQPCSNGLIRVYGARYARSANPADPILTRLYPSNFAPAFLEHEA